MNKSIQHPNSFWQDRAFRDFVAWALVLIVPTLFFLRFEGEMRTDWVMFLSLALGAVLLWIFRLVPDFVPGLAIVLLATMLGIVPQEVAFSGFYSQIFFLIFGIFVLSALLAETSWLPRLEAVLVNRNASTSARLFAIVGAGVLLTMLVPSPLGRSSMVMPLFRRFLKHGHVRNNDAFAVAHVHGNTLLSTVILTGNPLNFVLIAALNEQMRDRYDWLGWLTTASVAAAVLSFGLIALVFVLATRADKEDVAMADTRETAQVAPVVETDILRDWGTLALYGLLVLGIITRGIHFIPLEWIVLSLALVVFLFSGLPTTSLRTGIDWPTLIFVATVVSWGPMLDYLELSTELATYLPALVPLFDQSLYLGIAATIAGVFVVRLAVPGAPAFIIMSSAMLPFSESIGISPWVLGFVILTVSEGFIWPYQHGVQSQSLSMLDAEGYEYDPGRLGKINAGFYILRIAAIFASIPLWQSMNLV